MTAILKRDVKDLALFGGEPTFQQPLHVGAPNIGDRERFLKRLEAVLDTNWLTNQGPLVSEFEQSIADLLGTAHCIATCNGTIALELAIRALGLRGEVIVPSFTFVATAHALQWQEITPVFCDIQRSTHCIDPEAVKRLITPRTTGIIGVHTWGYPCPVDDLEDIAASHGIRLLFDAAHALAVTSNGKYIGNFGDAEVLSFHATKVLNTFEGGAVVTNNDDLAKKLRLMKNFGFSGQDNVVYIGTNGKMSEPCAAMGLTGLESLPEFIAINERNHRRYLSKLGDIPGLNFLSFPENEALNYQYIIVEIDEELAGLSRDALLQVLNGELVLARRYFYPGCHLMEPYRSYFPHAGMLLPNTEWLTERILNLPTGTRVSDCDIDAVCALVRFSIENGQEIQDRMRATVDRAPQAP